MATRRIGIDFTSALTQGGGIGRYTRELVHALVSEQNDNHYQLFSARITESYPVPNPLPVGTHVSYKPAPLTERWLYRLWYRARLPLPVQWIMGRLDLFHSPDFVLPPVQGDIPTLLTVHDLSFIHYPEVYPTALVSYLNDVVPWSVERATHILADSVATKNDLHAVWDVPEQKVTVLYSGVNENFKPQRSVGETAAVRARYKLGERPFVLAVGTIQPRKNYQMLIRAFKMVAEQMPHMLVIAGGKGWMEEEMIAEIQRQGLQERVIFSGFVDDDDLPALYRGASLLVFPSLYEGFGLPIIEAMASGLPALISNASCLPEVGGEAAVQLPPTDEAGWTHAILALLQDERKLESMKAAGIERAKLFTWKRAAKQLLTLYHSLTNA